MELSAHGWTARRGRVVLRLTCVRMGRDLSLSLAGGDREHIGAVALAQPRPSLSDPARTSSSVSVLTLLGHKEDELARAIAGGLAAALGVSVCVACGIHLDGLTPEEMAEVPALAGELVQELRQRLAGTD
ncbi:MAG TPA: hypothetical protein VK188_02600 [Holophaga sp.]|nr:hypothetical protein [Holophaga sp.]